MPANKVSVNNSGYAPTIWGQGESLKDFTTPSGQRCQIRIVSIETLAAEGLLDNFDIITQIMVGEVVQPATGKRPQDRQAKKPTKAEAAEIEAAETAARDSRVQKLITDPKQLVPMMDMINRVVEHIVVQPVVRRAVLKGADGTERPLVEREDGVVYVDTIPLEDRMALFATSFEGMSSLTSFRDEAKDAVGDVEDGGGVSLPAE
jgi:hypothetical protein